MILFELGPVVQEGMPLKDISYSRALAAPSFNGAELFVQFW